MLVKSWFWKLVVRCRRPGWGNWPAQRGRGVRRAPSAACARWMRCDVGHAGAAKRLRAGGWDAGGGGRWGDGTL